MSKEILLFLMILIDWTSHIFEAFFPLTIIFQTWKGIVHGIGYNTFWITYFGIALVLMLLIMKEDYNETTK